MLRKNIVGILTALALGLTGANVFADEPAKDEGEAASKCEVGESDTKPADACFKDLFTQCQEESKSAGTALCQTKLKKGETLTNVSATQGTLTAAAAALTKAAETCNANASKCGDKCSGDKIEICKEQLKKMADRLTESGKLATQSATAYGQTAESMGGGRDTKGNEAKSGKMDMGGMASMLGPAAAIGAMMASQQKEEEEDDSALYMGAVQKNGTVLCDRADSGMYSSCDGYLQAACLQAIQSGAYANSTTCSTFSQRFCTGGSGSAPPAAVAAPTTLFGATPQATGTPSTMPEVGAAGAGRNTTYCTAAVAYNYCAGGAHAQCPSCLGLGNVTSLQCQASPGSCLAQSSDATLAQARSSCPDDPMFQSSAPMISGAPTSNGSFGLGGVTTSAPNVITTNTGIVTSLPQSATAPTASAGSSGRAVSSTLQPNSVKAVGPASDIGAEYGPSLSNITGTTIKKRCQNDQLNCR